MNMMAKGKGTASAEGIPVNTFNLTVDPEYAGAKQVGLIISFGSILILILILIVIAST